MITSSGKVLQSHGKKFCVTCGEVRDHTCFHMAYRKSETSDDAYRKEERWNCDRCHTDKVIVREIPIPREKTMLVKLLVSLSEKYELEGTTISVDYREVRGSGYILAVIGLIVVAYAIRWRYKGLPAEKAMSDFGEAHPESANAD
jgi:hypothetical protein